MNQEKQTFVDPHTGEEMESTGLARVSVGLIGGLIGGLVGGLIGGGFGAALATDRWAMLLWGLAGGLLLGALTGLLVGLKFGLGAWGRALEEVRWDPLDRRVHDSVARRQHARRQRGLRRRAYPHVPDGALSRARPPGTPQPTATALSRAEPPQEEKAHLATGVEERAADEVRIDRNRN
jgi:hypothetical protein